MDQNVIEAIIPTVVVPFAFLSFLLSALAAFIASLFGIQLKTEGPKRLLEVLLKPKVLGTALLVNAAVWGGYRGYIYWRNSPSPLFWIVRQNPPTDGTARLYEDVLSRENTGAERIGPKHLAGFQEVWNKEIPPGFFNSATVSGSSVFAGSKDGYVHELDAASGEVLRRFFVGTHVTPAPLIWHGHLFVGEGSHDTHHARIYSFSLSTGALEGSFETSGHTEGTPAIVDGETPVLLIAAGKDGAYGVDPVTMKKIWHLPVGHVDSGFAVVGHTAYFATGAEKADEVQSARHAYAVDAVSGDVLWRRELAASGWMPPLPVKNQICYGLGEIYWESRYGQLACFDQASGRPTAAFNADGAVTSLLDARGDLLAFADIRGKVYVADVAAGRLLWSQETGSAQGATHDPSFSSPSFVSERLLVFPSFSEGLFVFDTASGDIQQKWKPDGWKKVYSRAMPGADGWFITDYTGRIIKFKLQESP